MSLHQNIIRIKAVHNALEELANEVVFVGGATVALYADRIANEVRPTDDVDILVELMNYGGYADDGRMSSDFEDIVFVLNYRGKIWDEMDKAPSPLKEYLQQEFNGLLSKSYMYEWIGVHLDFTEQKRVSHLIGGLQSIFR